MTHHRGYSLVELIVAIGLFAVVMTISTGAYLIMISVNREAQGLATGINNLSYALESMTRNIRTGTKYDCGASSFTFDDSTSRSITYRLEGTTLTQTIGDGTAIALTDPTVKVTSFTNQCDGDGSGNGTTSTDGQQAHVLFVIEGEVSTGPTSNKKQPFIIQTGATMRAVDL